MALFNRFLCWFPVAAGGIFAFYVGCLLVSAQIWNGAKIEAESQWAWILWAMNTIWIPIIVTTFAGAWSWAIIWSNKEVDRSKTTSSPTQGGHGVETDGNASISVEDSDISGNRGSGVFAAGNSNVDVRNTRIVDNGDNKGGSV